MDDAVRIAFEAGLPYTGLRDFRPDQRLWQAVAPDWARRERVVPLLVVGDRLKLAAARPDPDLSGVRETFGAVDVVIAPAAEIDAVLATLQALPAAAGRDGRGPVTDPATPRRLGDLLVAHGAASDAEIAAALDEQARTGGRLGDVLLARESVSEERLLAALGEQLGLPMVDLHGYEPEPAAVSAVPDVLQRRLRIVPLAVDRTAIYVAAAEPLADDELVRLREGAGDREPRCFLAPGAAVDELLVRLHAERWAATTRSGLAARYPGESSAQAGRAPIVVLLVAVAAALVAGVALDARTTAVAAAGFAAVALAGPALLALPVALVGLRRWRPPAGPRPGGLPLTSLLVPLGADPDAPARAQATLHALDHPRARLEVLVLCPGDDPAAVRAARDLVTRPGRRLVPVPATLPPTRAAALAYGLLLARGEHVAVLDPGDVPARGALEAAGGALAARGARVAAAQASLVPSPAGGVAGRWLAAEYAAWHELLAPGLVRLRLPLPLSSTGTVLRRSALDAVEAWDPMSPAEGVELGLRLHKAGFRATMAGAAVAVAGLGQGHGWLRTHAGWWCGALAAWSVQARHPLRALRRFGLRGAAGQTLAGLGAVVAPLVWPFVLAAAVLGGLDAIGVHTAVLPDAAMALAGLGVLAACAALVLLGLAGAARRRSPSAALCAVLAPVAITIMALAAWVGLAGVVGRLGRPLADDRLTRW